MKTNSAFFPSYRLGLSSLGNLSSNRILGCSKKSSLNYSLDESWRFGSSGYHKKNWECCWWKKSGIFSQIPILLDNNSFSIGKADTYSVLSAWTYIVNIFLFQYRSYPRVLFHSSLKYWISYHHETYQRICTRWHLLQIQNHLSLISFQRKESQRVGKVRPIHTYRNRT